MEPPVAWEAAPVGALVHPSIAKLIFYFFTTVKSIMHSEAHGQESRISSRAV